jgi:hypothetical protein
MLAAGGALLQTACPTGSGNGTETEAGIIPDATSITFNGKEVKIIHYDGELGDAYHVLQIRWRSEYNNID